MSSTIIQINAELGFQSNVKELGILPGSKDTFTRMFLQTSAMERADDDITLVVYGTVAQQLDVCSTIATALNDHCETLARRLDIAGPGNCKVHGDACHPVWHKHGEPFSVPEEYRDDREYRPADEAYKVRDEAAPLEGIEQYQVESR